MRQTIILAVICVGLLVCAVGYSDSRYRTAIGRVAPPVYVCDNGSSVSLDSLRGHYVILNFWNSTDAPSREAANLYTAWGRRHHSSGVDLVSVNFDESAALYHEIVRRDSLDPSQQFHAEGTIAKAIIDNYGLEDGYGSLLINPQGKIIAHNPKPDELEELIRTR